MLTYSGVSICPGEVALPSPVDLAVQMGRITRYGGAIWCPLLFHSLLVARMVADEVDDPRVVTWALFHDAHEIVIGEIPHPWKTAAQKDHEAVIDAVFLVALGLEEAYGHPAIKQADRAAIHVETRALGPLAEWEDYRERWDRGFNAGDLTDAKTYAACLIWGGFADAGLTTSSMSGPIKRAQRIFEIAFAHDYVGVARSIKELTV